ncbi:unnamed protein product [Vitrella brassicaformis CCMP3155]|uniref:Transmembrane protein n=1 Tax=Vitrella brassicaformis (strain CCMP3155) TaxID=1169540 RepID=A0A0G4EWH3_VITBC|nr:unnamed protein product [Vitrella brassicaformis CCMP3155]|eukprot:CEM02603.1 unnamed protein product [Vitrella brassicaformis CCMP3155]
MMDIEPLSLDEASIDDVVALADGHRDEKQENIDHGSMREAVDGCDEAPSESPVLGDVSLLTEDFLVRRGPGGTARREEKFAYEEFSAAYETRVNDSGEVEEKFVATTPFTPEPFIKTMQRVARVLLCQFFSAVGFAAAWSLFCVGVWQTCEYHMSVPGWIVLDGLRLLLPAVCYSGILFLMAEGDVSRAMRRFRTAWWLPVCIILLQSLRIVFHYVDAIDSIVRKLTFFAAWSVFAVLVPFVFFRWTAHWRKETVRKTVYALQLTLMNASSCTVSAIIQWWVFLPLGARVATDGERTRLVVVFLLALSPLAGLMGWANRAVREGPVLTTAPSLAFAAVAFSLFPRFGCFDLATDVTIPYGVLVGGACRKLFSRLMSRQRIREHHCDAIDAIDVRDTEESVVNDTSPDKSACQLSNLSTTVTESPRQLKKASDRLRHTFSRSSFASQLSAILDAQSKLRLTFHPIFLRRLSDQVHLYGLAELTALVFSNLCSIIFEQMLHPSGERLAERVAGLAVLVLIEMGLEFLLFCVSTT